MTVFEGGALALLMVRQNGVTEAERPCGETDRRGMQGVITEKFSVMSWCAMGCGN